MEPLKQSSATRSALQSISRLLSNDIPLDDILYRITEHALQVIDDAPQGCISHIALHEDDHIVFKAATPNYKLPPLVEKFDQLRPEACGIAGRAVSRGEVQIVPDVRDSVSYLLLDDRIRSQISVPMIFEERVIGVLSIEHPDADAFHQTDIENLQILVNIAAIAIDRKQQEEKRTRRTIRNKLTTLTAKMENARKEAERSERLRTTALALIETFSHFNDITDRDQPLEGFWRMFDALLPEICHHIGAEIGVVLYQDHNHYLIKTQYPMMYSPEETFYALDDDEWEAILHHRGGLYGTTVSDFVKDYNAHLPFNEWVFIDPDKTEIVVTLADGYGADSRIVMILAAQTDDGKTWFNDQDEIFNLIALRMRELYNAAYKLDTQLSYEKDRQQFIQDVMHQLVGPLGGIKADAELLYLKVFPTEEDEILSRLMEQASLFQAYAVNFSLAAESTNILQISESTFHEVNRDELIALLNQYAGSFQGQAAHKQIDGPRIIRESFKNFPPLSINREYFGILLLNLYDNAVKYSYTGYNAPIKVVGKAQSRSVEIMITNHGVDVSQRDVERIFERYARAESAQNHAPIGTGIGLYLCDKIMKLHGGSITVAPSRPSTLVEGAHEVTFTLRLPIGR